MIITAKVYSEMPQEAKAIIRNIAQIYKNEDIGIGEVFAYFFHRYNAASFESFVNKIQKFIRMLGMRYSKIFLLAKNNLPPRSHMQHMIERFASDDDVATIAMLSLYVPMEIVYQSMLRIDNDNASEIFNIKLPEYLIIRYGLHRKSIKDKSQKSIDVYRESYRISSMCRAICGWSIADYRNMYMKMYGITGTLINSRMNTLGIYNTF